MEKASGRYSLGPTIGQGKLCEHTTYAHTDTQPCIHNKYTKYTMHNPTLVPLRSVTSFNHIRTPTHTHTLTQSPYRANKQCAQPYGLPTFSHTHCDCVSVWVCVGVRMWLNDSLHYIALRHKPKVSLHTHKYTTHTTYKHITTHNHTLHTTTHIKQ